MKKPQKKRRRRERKPFCKLSAAINQANNDSIVCRRFTLRRRDCRLADDGDEIMVADRRMIGQATSFVAPSERERAGNGTSAVVAQTKRRGRWASAGRRQAARQLSTTVAYNKMYGLEIKA